MSPLLGKQFTHLYNYIGTEIKMDIHPSIIYTAYSFRFTGKLELISANFGYILGRFPIYHRANADMDEQPFTPMEHLE